jgi:hypothetical protein
MHDKFNRVLSGLKDKRGSESYNQWEEPFANDPAIRLLERTFSESCARMCLSSNSYLSIDDDQYHLQSKKSEDLGLTRVNNPKKAFGPVSTNVVSLASGIIVGMRLLGRGENYQTVVKILLRWIHFQDCDDRVRGSNTLIQMSIEEILLPNWFMKPIKATPLKLGSKNEVCFTQKSFTLTNALICIEKYNQSITSFS